MAIAPAPAPAKKTVKLLAPHTDAGRDYPVGAVLTLFEDQADWLIALGCAEPAPKGAQSNAAPAA